MRKTISVAALLLALACSAHAGEMQNEAPKPPPSHSVSVMHEPMDGGTATDETPAGTADVLKQIVLDVFAVLPSLL